MNSPRHIPAFPAGRAMSECTRLPNRRASTTFDIESLGLSYTVTVSPGAGEPREVFITNHKAGVRRRLIKHVAAAPCGGHT